MVTLIIGNGGVLQGLNWRGKTRHFLPLTSKNTLPVASSSRATRMFGFSGWFVGL